MENFGSISDDDVADTLPMTAGQPALLRPKLQRCMTLPAANWYGVKVDQPFESANALQRTVDSNNSRMPEQPLNDVDWGLSPITPQRGAKTFQWYACVELRGIYHAFPEFPLAARGRIAGFDDIEDARWFMRRHGVPEYWHEDPSEHGMYVDRGDIFASLDSAGTVAQKPQ